MSDDIAKKQYDLAISTLKANTMANGYAALKVSDGEFIMFSKEYLAQMLANIDADQDSILIFIKHGPTIGDMV